MSAAEELRRVSRHRRRHDRGAIAVFRLASLVILPLTSDKVYYINFRVHSERYFKLAISMDQKLECAIAASLESWFPAFAGMTIMGVLKDSPDGNLPSFACVSKEKGRD